MIWESSSYLLAIWVPVALGGLLFFASKRRRNVIAGFVATGMQPRLLPTRDSVRAVVKAAALLLGLLLLIVAAARPRWGVFYQNISQRGVDVFVLLDVSKSMLAEDVSPNRLDRAKSDIKDLLKKLNGDRVGLIAFAGAPVVKVPLTTDTGFFESVLDEISPDSAPRGGSLIGDAIRKATVSMAESRERDRAIVLITDGEDHDSFPEEAAVTAAEQEIKIFAVGLGDTTEGARIPSRDSKSGALSFVQHDGQEVWSTMDEELLKTIAMKTQGAYIPARTRVYDLGEIYENHLSKLESSDMATTKRKNYREQFQLFAGLAFLLLLVETVIPVWQRRTKAEEAKVENDLSASPLTSVEKPV